MKTVEKEVVLARESKTKQIIYKRKGLKRERESSNVFYLLKIR